MTKGRFEVQFPAGHGKRLLEHTYEAPVTLAIQSIEFRDCTLSALTANGKSYYYDNRLWLERLTLIQGNQLFIAVEPKSTGAECGVILYYLQGEN